VPQGEIPGTLYFRNCQKMGDPPPRITYLLYR